MDPRALTIGPQALHRLATRNPLTAIELLDTSVDLGADCFNLMLAEW
ncbi:MAG TPA: hypothetical protein VG204_10520 [Terriglobia bacterium]|nr:hypothetical protein [Terriglobia bacterium]